MDDLDPRIFVMGVLVVICVVIFVGAISIDKQLSRLEARSSISKGDK